MFKEGESGNPNGRPKGAKSEKTRQWDALAESIVGIHADNFNNIMNADYVDAMDHEDEEIKMNARSRYTNNYIKIMEFFKPKQARTTIVGDDQAPPVQIIVKSNL
jgi:Family of unknown function (DUF5681)